MSKLIVNKLVEECCENIYGNEMVCNETVNDYKKVGNFCTLYIILFVIFLTISISICSAFIYFYWFLKKDNIKGNSIETTIY